MMIRNSRLSLINHLKNDIGGASSMLLLCRRSLATITPSSPNDQQEKTTTTKSTLIKVQNFVTSRRGMITIGGTLFAYVVGRTAYKVMHTFLHLDFYTVGEIGFVAGFLTATSGFGFFTYCRSLMTIDVEKVKNDALELVQQSPKVKEVMGLEGFSFGTVQTGTIRTYQMEGGNFGISETTRLPVWKFPKVQLMFQVWGGSKEKQAVVVVEAVTTIRGTRQFNFISFDLLAGKSGFQGENPTVIVIGDESSMKVRNDMRSFVTLHRVYVRGLDEL